MISRRHLLVQGGLTRLGSLGTSSTRVFGAPDSRAARALIGVCTAMILLIVLEVARLNPALSLLLPLGLLAGLLVVIQGQERLLLVGLSGLMALGMLLGGGLALLFVTAGLLYTCSRYLLLHRTAFQLEAQLPLLGQALGPSWKAYLPKDPQAQHVARVLVSPDGQTFFLGLVQGRSEQKYGTAHVAWKGLVAEGVRELARRDPGVVQDGQTVLWVMAPKNVPVDVTPTLDQGVTTVVASPGEMAAQLKDWSSMVARLDGPTPTAADQGRAAETQAIAELEARLTGGWRMRSNVLLARGGDADVELVAPHGEKYIIDIKSRTDRMDLQAPRGERVKSWADIHAQVVGAARQLQGVPVIWQPLTRDEDFSLVGEVWCLRGPAQTLLDALGTLGAAEQVGQGATAHEVLGVQPNASREDIQAAYKALARQYHPDRVASLGAEFRALAERRMKAINAAYQALMA